MERCVSFLPPRSSAQENIKKITPMRVRFENASKVVEIDLDPPNPFVFFFAIEVDD